jgi:hypothetical protein
MARQWKLGATTAALLALLALVAFHASALAREVVP